jgi:hypothetical protein
VFSLDTQSKLFALNFKSPQRYFLHRPNGQNNDSKKGFIMSATAAQNLNSNEVNSLTSQFMDAVSGTHPEVGRDKGLLVTNEDIRKIKRYVNTSLALPIVEEQIEQLYKFDQLKISGLTSRDMQGLYQTMKDHAGTWSPIESGMKKVGADLHVFSDNFTSGTVPIIDYLKSIPSYNNGVGKIGDLTPEEIEKLPAIQLTEAEQQKIPTLLALVDELKNVITQHSQSTKTIKTKITQFKDKITDTIKPSLGLKIALCNSQNFSDKIKQLNQRLDVLNGRISEKYAEIEQYGKNKWWGAFGGGIGFLITSSIYGNKAKQARTELDQLTAERRDIEKEIGTSSELLAVLLAQETNLQDLQVRVEGASSSASNLESLWELIQTYVDSSSNKLDGVTNAMYLVVFASRLNTMVENWKNVKKQAGDLLTAFNNAAQTR